MGLSESQQMLCLSPQKYMLMSKDYLNSCATHFLLLCAIVRHLILVTALCLSSLFTLSPSIHLTRLPQSSLNPLIFSKSFCPPLTHSCDTEHTLWSVCQMLLARFAVSDVMTMFTLLWTALASPELGHLCRRCVNVWLFHWCWSNWAQVLGAWCIFPMLVRKFKLI